jgi:hypothetical protein
MLWEQALYPLSGLLTHPLKIIVPPDDAILSTASRADSSDLPITSRMLGVELDGTRRIVAAHVGWLVDLDGSRRRQTERLDDHLMVKCLPRPNRMARRPGPSSPIMFLALPFALAAELPGWREPGLGLGRLTSHRRRCFSMSRLELPIR